MSGPLELVMATTELRPRPALQTRPAERILPSIDRRPRLTLAALHLSVLWSFAVARPLFAALDDGMLFYLFQLGRAEIVTWALLVVLAPPAAMLCFEVLLSRWSRRAAWWLHVSFVAGLAGIFTSQLSVDIVQPSGELQTMLSLAGALTFALAYARWAPVRSVLTALSPTPVVFLCLFLFFSPVHKFVSASQATLGKTIATRTPVVMIVLDEFPGGALMGARGGIDGARYPSFARLARESTWFRNASTVHSFTEDAVPALVTGRRSEPGSLPIAADHPENLFSLFGRSVLTASEQGERLCPRDFCPETRSLASRLSFLVRRSSVLSAAQWLPSELVTRISPEELPGGHPEAQGATFGRSVERAGRAGLHYVHLIVPHSPWRYLPSGRHHAKPQLVPELWPNDEWAVTQAQQAFLLQAAYTDRLLGRILDRLRRIGMYDRALVIVVADHGISFRPGGRSREATPQNAEDIMSVPLFIKRPGQRRGRVSKRHVRTIDVVPSIADVLDFDLPWRAEGESVLGARRATDGPLDVHTRAGGRVTIDRDQFVRRRDAAIWRQAAQFGTGLADLYRVGPHSELIGRRPGRTRVVSGAAVQLKDGPTPSVDLDSATVPATVVGMIGGPEASRIRELAVTVNGLVVATTRAVRGGDRVAFTALVPESSLRQGTNQIKVYAISRGTRSRLDLLPTRP